jgi:predicted MFS family arabinose efflux permease
MTCHAPQVMRLVGDRERTGAIALAMMVTAPVAGFGPFLAGLLIPAAGYRPVFLVVAAVAAASALLLWRFVPDTARPPDDGR